MKKIFTLLVMCLMAVGSVLAAETTITFSDLYGAESVQPATTVTSGAFTFSFTKGNSATEPAYFVNTSVKEMRLYGGSADAPAGNTMTVTSTSHLTKMVLSGGSKPTRWADLTADNGTITLADDGTATWIAAGNVTSVTITVNRVAEGASQMRFATAVITSDGEQVVPSPTFSSPAGTYYAPFDLTLKCGLSSASIHYTLDGSTPTTSSTLYSAPIRLSANTTVKAVAAFEGKLSEVAVAEYVFESAINVSDISTYNGVDDSTVVRFANGVNVLAQYRSNLYVKDASGYALIYGTTGQTYKNGDAIPAGFVGQKVTYNGKPELTNPLSGFEPAASNTPIPAEEMTVSQLNGDLWGHYVLIKNATIKPGAKTITDATGSWPIHTSMGGYSSSTDSTKTYDVYAIVGAYKSASATEITYQLLPTELKTSGGGGGNSGTIADFQTVADGTAFTFTQPATVLGQSGKYLYVTDGTGYMLAYGTIDQTYAQGDVIPAGYAGTKTTYKDEPELADPTGFQAKTSHVDVTAETLALTGLAHENFGKYVVVKRVKYDTIGDPGTLKDESGNTGDYYNKTFNASVPADITQYYNVYGIVGKHNNYQLLVMKYELSDGGEITVPDVAALSELYAMSQGVVAHFTEPVTVIYQNWVADRPSNEYTYVKVGDEYGMVYGYLTNKFANGDYIDDAKASWSDYYGVKEIIPVDSTWVKAGHAAAVTPEEIPLEEVSLDIIHTYLTISGATVTMDSTNYYTVSDGTDSLLMFNKFADYANPVVIPEIVAGKTYDVKCFVSMYKSNLQLIPVEVKEHGAALVGDVNGDGLITIADANVVISIILNGVDSADEATLARADVNGDGLVTIADANVVISIILGNK